MATNRGTRRQCFKVGRLDQRLKQILCVSILNEGYDMLRKIKHTVYNGVDRGVGGVSSMLRLAGYVGPAVNNAQIRYEAFGAISYMNES